MKLLNTSVSFCFLYSYLTANVGYIRLGNLWTLLYVHVYIALPSNSLYETVKKREIIFFCAITFKFIISKLCVKTLAICLIENTNATNYALVPLVAILANREFPVSLYLGESIIHVTVQSNSLFCFKEPSLV